MWNNIIFMKGHALNLLILLLKMVRNSTLKREIYQSEDPSPIKPTHRKKEENEIIEEDKKGSEQPRPIKKMALLF